MRLSVALQMRFNTPVFRQDAAGGGNIPETIE